MSVDYHACHECMEARYEEFVAECNSCGGRICIDCLVNTEGISRDGSYVYPFADEDGYLEAKHCPKCSAESEETQTPMNANALQVRIKRLHNAAAIPQYAHPGADSGFDLVAVEDVIVRPGETVRVPTGLAFEIPPGFEMQVRARSGISAKTKLRVSNSPGTVDSSFRGEVCVLIDNISMDTPCVRKCAYRIDGTRKTLLGKYPIGTYIVEVGTKIAQGVIAPVVHASFEEVDELSETGRGSGGFGSSGVSV